MQCLNTQSVLCVVSLLVILSLAACEEDVAPPTGVDEPFSLYGVFNPRLPMQAVLVGPVEDLLFPETRAPLDAVVTSTDLGNGITYVWQDSVSANATGQLDHIFVADFFPAYGSRHRLDVVRSDGEHTFVEVEVPGETRIEDSDAGTRDIHVRILGLDDADFVLPRIETMYSVSFYHTDDPDTVCNTPRKRYIFSHKGTEEKTDQGWKFTIDLNIFYETMRSYYHDDTGIRFWNPDRDGLALLDMELEVTIGNVDWDPPGGNFSDERVLVHPGTLSNVENGYGLVVGGYNEETVLYPSFRAVADTPFFDYIQRNGGDYCLGTL